MGEELLDAKDAQLLNAYMATANWAEAAAMLGMDRTTAWRRGSKEPFQRELRRRLGEESARAEAALASRQDAAWAALDACLTSPNENVLLRTAMWLLDRILSAATSDASRPSVLDLELEKTQVTLLKVLRSGPEEAS